MSKKKGIIYKIKVIVKNCGTLLEKKKKKGDETFRYVFYFFF